MNKPKIIEKEEEIVCGNKHFNQPIICFLNDKSIDLGQRLQCLVCMKEVRHFPQSTNFLEARQIIQDNQDNLYQQFSSVTKRIRDCLETLTQNVNKLKTQMNKQLDSMITNAENWSKNLQDMENKKLQYSLFKELANFDEPIHNKFIAQVREIQQCNQSYFKKIQLQLGNDQYTRAIQQCQNILEDIIIQVPNPEGVKSLQQICQQHNSQIIYVDIKEQKLKCMHCGQGEAITVTEFESKWKARQLLQNERIEQIQKQRAELYQKQRKLLKKLLLDQQICITDWLVQINQQQYFSNQYRKQIDQLEEMAIEYNSHQNSEIIKEEKIDVEQKKANQASFIKLQQIYNSFDDQIQNLHNLSNIQLIDNPIAQQEFAGAFAFNKDNTLMAAGCENSINLWKFDQGQIIGPPVKLKGHIDKLFCLAFSKQYSWLASGSRDSTIRLWKGTGEWQSSKPGTQHNKAVECIIMNKSETQLFSSSWDKCIIVWKINYESNSLQFEYQLKYHTDEIYQISLNEQETQLVSTGLDKQIIIWEKGENTLFAFKQAIKKSANDFGQRVCFINDDKIAWLQNNGQLHFFQSENGQFIERPEQVIQLSKYSLNNATTLFPFIYNKDKQLLICKHNQNIYLIRIRDVKSLDCQCQYSYGSLSNNGEYLVTWTCQNKLLQVYRV